MPRTPKLEDLENATSEAKPIGIPPGAQVNVRFNTPVDPSTLQQGARSYQDNDLRELAGEEFPDIPPDPLSDFCAEWANFSGYSLKIIRLPDPALRKQPGHTYNRICFELENLSDMPFDPVNLVGGIQLVNGNSGGVFRIWLVDEIGQPIPGARLDRLVIADPPKQYNQQERQQQASPYQQPPAPAKHEPSEFEVTMQGLQKRLLENALAKLMEPPPPSITAAPGSNLSDEDRITLMLVKQGDMLPAVLQRLTTLAGAPDAAALTPTWKDRLADAASYHIMNNPVLVERVSSTIERIVARILPSGSEPAVIQQLPQPQQQYITPAQQPQQLQPSTTAPSGLPEAPDADEDEPLSDEEETMVLLEDLFALLTSDEKLVVNHPVFAQLQQEHPRHFKGAVMLIASQPLDAIIEWIKTKSPLYASMLESPRTGPYYYQRLQELQTLFRTPAQPAPAPSPINNAKNETETKTETPPETQNSPRKLRPRKDKT